MFYLWWRQGWRLKTAYENSLFICKWAFTCFASDDLWMWIKIDVHAWSLQISFGFLCTVCRDHRFIIARWYRSFLMIEVVLIRVYNTMESYPVFYSIIPTTIIIFKMLSIRWWFVSLRCESTSFYHPITKFLFINAKYVYSEQNEFGENNYALLLSILIPINFFKKIFDRRRSCHIENRRIRKSILQQKERYFSQSSKS